MNYTGGMYGLGDTSNLGVLSAFEEGPAAIAESNSNQSAGADSTLIDIAGDVWDQLANGTFGVPETAGYQPDYQASGGFATPPTGANPTVTTIADVQSALNVLGYDAGPVDGINGPQTKGAVANYQRDNGLPVDGIAGPMTKAALSSSISRSNPMDPATLTQDTVWPAFFPNPFESAPGQILAQGGDSVIRQADANARASSPTTERHSNAEIIAAQGPAFFGGGGSPAPARAPAPSAAAVPSDGMGTILMVGAGVAALGALAYFLTKK